MIVSAEDCILGDWEEWGECSAQCGKEGYKTRHRKILQQQKFAGAECGPTTQKTYCIGTECRERRFGLGGTKQEISGEYVIKCMLQPHVLYKCIRMHRILQNIDSGVHLTFGKLVDMPLF